MKAKLILFAMVTLVTALSTSDASAYNRYSYRRGGGGGGGYGGAGSTVYGSAMLGQAAYTTALGRYQVMNAQANILNQQAFTAYLQNRKNYAQTYFDLKRMHESWVAEQDARHPPLTREQLEAVSKLGVPKRLGSEDFDPSTAIINWPEILKGPQFDEHRSRLEQLFADRAGAASGLGTDNYHDIRLAASQMQDKLQGMVKEITPDEYVQGHRFISSLSYEGRFTQPGDAVANK
jgi:hypothetical protein